MQKLSPKITYFKSCLFTIKQVKQSKKNRWIGRIRLKILLFHEGQGAKRAHFTRDLQYLWAKRCINCDFASEMRLGFVWIDVFGSVWDLKMVASTKTAKISKKTIKMFKIPAKLNQKWSQKWGGRVGTGDFVKN